MKKARIITTLLLVATLCFATFAVPFKGTNAAESTVKITSKAMKKAKPSLDLYVSGILLNVKAMKVSAKVDGTKTTLIYVPAAPVAEFFTIDYAAKKKKVTLSSFDGYKLTFKVGKDGYKLTGPDIKDTFMAGRAVIKNDLVYVPVDVFTTIGAYLGLPINATLDGKKLEISTVSIGGDDIITGGWEAAASPVVSSKVAKLVKKASKEIASSTVTPVALLATQLVAGTNYKLLCRFQEIDSGEISYVIAVMYVDLEGNAEFTELHDTGVDSNVNNLPGGWSQPPTVEMTDQYLAAFDQVMAELDGVSYTPLAVLEYQVVAGVNACVLCESTVVYPGAEPYYSFVYFFIDLAGGKASITDIVRAE